jgi:hypothetical protein
MRPWRIEHRILLLDGLRHLFKSLQAVESRRQAPASIPPEQANPFAMLNDPVRGTVALNAVDGHAWRELVTPSMVPTRGRGPAGFSPNRRNAAEMGDPR